MSTNTKKILQKLHKILGTEVTVKVTGYGAKLTAVNPQGTSTLCLELQPGEDLKLTLGKTARYYPEEEDTRKKMWEDITAYAQGKLALLDYQSVEGDASRQDRLVTLQQLESLTTRQLWELAVQTGLCGSKELDDLLLQGGRVRVHFWDSDRNYDLIYTKGDQLCKAAPVAT